VTVVEPLALSVTVGAAVVWFVTVAMLRLAETKE
jgi:hypothetical protein